MIRKRTFAGMILLVIATTLALFVPAHTAAQGQSEDPPTRIARLAYSQGSVSFQPAGTDDWVDAAVNRPVTIGDKLWADSNGRVEMQLDGSLIRLSNNTGVSFLNLNDNVTQIQLSSGTLLLRVRRLDDNESYEVDTPNLAFSILRPGVYRVSVDESGVNTAIRVRSGEGEVTGGGAAYTVHPNEFVTFSGTDGLAVDPRQYDGRDEDQFDVWASNRDAHWSHSNSARYVSADVVGYEDLDDHGDWRATQQYGNVWYPRTRERDWAPYHYGHWAYIEPWGYSWVDDEPWGFAPFHYGRWVSVEGRWGWVPAPPRVEGVVYVRPVYATALVAWVNVGGGGGIAVGGGGVAAGVAWFALGPREVYVPSYRVSERYVNNINVSNTNVSTTVVTNTYNTTIVNKNVNVTNVTYVNQNVQGAVAATTAQAFTNAQPVAQNAVHVDAHAVASAPVRVVTPAVVPSKQAVLGTPHTEAAVKPPAVIEARAVVAKQAPPPAPPAFEKRQEAIKNNGGQPLSVAQVRQIQPTAAVTEARPAPVKIAPQPTQPAIPAANAPASARPGATPSNAPANANRPANAQPNQPAAAQPQPQPGNRPNAQPNQPAAAQPQPQPGNRPNSQPNQPAAAQPQPQPGNRPNAQPNQPAAAQPQPQPGNRPANTNNNAPPNQPARQDRPATQNTPAEPARPNSPNNPNIAAPPANQPNHPIDRPVEHPVPNNAPPPPANHPVDRPAERPMPNNTAQPPANNRPENRPPTNNPPNNQPAPTNPPPGNANRNSAPTHPNELPPVQRNAAPASNPQLQQKHDQEQAQLRAQQEQERQKIQQQQEQEHQRLAQQQADAAKKQQIEQQHQQQTQQLQQKHTQEQQQLQQKQQQEKQQQDKNPPKNPPAKTDRPPQQ
jgi:hypothetical protein